MWLATRVVLVAFTLAAELIRLGGRADGYRQFSPRDILYTWKQWDAYWYTEIAHQGYWTWQSTAFFPLYPLMIRLTSFVVGQHWLLIAMGIASLAALGAFAGVGLLAANEQGGTRAATRAVRVFAAYPLAFFLTAPYTEGLFVALAAFTLLFARRWMWRWAALTAILAALTRPTAVVLFLPLVWELGRQRGWWRTLSGVFGSLRQQEWAGLAELRMRVRAWRARRWASALDWRAVADAVLLVVAIPAGFGIFMGYLWLRFGHPLLFLHAQRLYWQRFNVPPWDSIPMAINQLAGLPALSYYQARALVDYGPLVLFTLVTLLMIRRQPFSFTLYTAGLLYLAVASPMVATRDPDMFQSAGRFLLAAVPVFLLLGRWIRRRPALDLLLIGGGFLLQAALAAYYLSGGWLT
ncbi:MAG TPA: hypothetical protein VFU88_14595 [Ktedonobacterales bacterium]|nr:hypothetical protein [Ktedonobacterales bacterium]